MFISPALERGVSCNYDATSPVGTRFPQSPENVTIVVFDPTAAQQDDKFLLKIAFAMMLFLALNVPFHDLNL